MSPKQPLTGPETRWRCSCLALITVLLLTFGVVEPASLPKWFPFPISCGAITGLPCIFCGMTRASYYLLHGEFGRAVYYNWLAFPSVAGAIAMFVITVLELIFDRKLLPQLPSLRVTRASFVAMALGFVFLWCFQVYLAVSLHKSELLNPNGPLYSLVVH